MTFQDLGVNSKSEDGHVAAAAVLLNSPPSILKHRLIDGSSIFSAELQAVVLALKHVYLSKHTDFLILSDSLSALQALLNNKLDHPLLVQIRELHATLLKNGKDIVFIWIPSHCGIRGNSQADFHANQARDGPVDSKTTIYSDFKPSVYKYITKMWQEHWDTQPSNKLHSIVPNLNECISRCRKNRREEVVLCRLHIGHSYFTHSYLLKDEEAPFCFACNEPNTLKHILLTCSDLIQVRRKYFSAESMELLFRNVPPDSIFNFLREVNIYHQI